MKTCLFLALCCASASVFAQTTAQNTLPDGSKDIYLGLAVESLPRFEGSDDQRTIAVPVVQMQWSNGIFWNGMSAGMHLSQTAGIEYGPLVAIEPGRGSTHTQVIGIGANASVIGSTQIVVSAPAHYDANIQEVGARPEAGGFFNYYFSEKTRLTSNLLYGAGERRDGLILTVDVQHSFTGLAPHHTFSISAGFNAVNKNYDQSYFGINEPQPEASNLIYYGAPPYETKGGVEDLHIGAHWNWALSNSWLLTSGVQATHLTGPAADSPLTDKHNNATLFTGLAYRF